MSPTDYERLAGLVERSPQDIKLLVDWLLEAAITGADPAHPAVRSEHWAKALDQLVAEGGIEAASVVADKLALAFPGRGYLRSMARLFRAMPPRGDGDSELVRFVDDPNQEVQVVCSRGSYTVLFVFCGLGDRAGLDLNILHRWLAPLGVHLVYLRDFSRLMYVNGMGSLGSDYADSVRELKSVAKNLDASRVLCYGNSAGVFGALRYGLDLGAETVLAVGGPTNLRPEFVRDIERHAVYDRILAVMPEMAQDLRPLFEAAHRPPAVRLIYAGGRLNDRAHAENLSGLPTVVLEPVPGYVQHNVVKYLALEGRFGDALQWLVQPRAP